MDFTVTIQLSLQHHVLEHSKAVTMTKLNVTCFFQVKKKESLAIKIMCYLPGLFLQLGIPKKVCTLCK